MEPEYFCRLRFGNSYKNIAKILNFSRKTLFFVSLIYTVNHSEKRFEVYKTLHILYFTLLRLRRRIILIGSGPQHQEDKIGRLRPGPDTFSLVYIVKNSKKLHFLCGSGSSKRNYATPAPAPQHCHFLFYNLSKFYTSPEHFTPKAPDFMFSLHFNPFAITRALVLSLTNNYIEILKF
jgi:hypothetical protein